MLIEGYYFDSRINSMNTKTTFRKVIADILIRFITKNSKKQSISFDVELLENYK